VHAVFVATVEKLETFLSGVFGASRLPWLVVQNKSGLFYVGV